MAKVTNPKQIKRKIRSVQNLKKITKAMEMVAAAKLRRVQGGLEAIRPYSDKLEDVLKSLASRAGQLPEAEMLTPREEVRRVAYVVFAADKGLCGSYNSNVLRLADRVIAGAAAPTRVYAVGRRTAQFFRKKGIEPAAVWQGLPANVGIAEGRELTSEVIGAYERHEVDEVHLVYTEFQSMVRLVPTAKQFLPFDLTQLTGGEEGDGEESAGASAPAQELIFEPEPKVILAQLLPRHIEVQLFRILLESLASEYAARMQAMRNATDNAEEMVRDLTLTYNKARQASITTELIDIVGGAEALRG